MFSIRNSENLAIDLGNNNTLLTDQSNILISQPSCLVINKSSNRVEAVGNQAFEMMEKSHHDLKPVRPLKGGVITDGESAKKLLKELVNQVQKKSLFKSGFNYLLSGIPFDTTSVERRALRDALEQFSSRNTYLIHEPIAAGLGMGLNIQEPEGKLLVDIGGGITEVVVISLSGVAAFRSARIAGDAMDEAIQDYFRREHNLIIGQKSAEKIKMQIGCVHTPLASNTVVGEVKGKDMVDGIPVSKKISQAELAPILLNVFEQVEDCIQQTLEECPPELASDIYQTGIYVTGGTALLKGVSERLSKRFKLQVNVDDQCLLSVSKGISKVLADPKKFKPVLFQ